MCYNCGCHNRYDDMGDQNNITEETFAHIAKHDGKSLEEVKRDVYELLGKKGLKKEDPHLTEMFEKAARAWDQSVEEARKNTYKLLEDELE